MNIAVIGWGSLIWCPGSLRIRSRWRTDGPVLPIEFARISDDGRLTLVIHSGSTPQPTYWALSELTDLEDARENVKEREGCSLKAVPYFPNDDASLSIPPEVETELESWLASHEEVEVAMWTGLTTNWWEKRNRDFSPEDAVHYLDEVRADRRLTKTYERSREYVQNAPPSIQTEVRKRMREKSWIDTKLSEVLFETNQGD